MIGLLDYDALQQGKIRHPNLELMKMATYFRRQRQMVQIVTNLEEIERYSEIYLFQDNEKLPYPSEILRRPNVKWFGLAFSSGVYSPPQKEIEECEPSASIYKLLFKDFILQDKIKLEQVSHFLNASYVRLLGPLNKKYLKSIKPRRRVFVYDTDLFLGEWRKNTEAILKRGALGFNFIYPQHFSDYNLWIELTTKYDRTVFARNNITLSFDFTRERVLETQQIHRQLTGDRKTQYSGLKFEIAIGEPFRQNTLLFGETLIKTAYYGAEYPLVSPPFIGNPYHPIVNALVRWRASPNFYDLSFIDYCEKRRFLKERAFAIKLAKESKKYVTVFATKPENIVAMYGGLQSYGSCRNSPSIYESYLRIEE